jgi:thiol-disulfide isomerase/thioredoxin
MLNLVVILTLIETGLGAVQTLHDGTFHERLQPGNWLIVFSTSWCETCKMLAPIINEVGADHRLLDAGITIGKVRDFFLKKNRFPYLLF